MRRPQHMFVAGFLMIIAALGGVAITASPAQAGSATCKATLSWNMASGGCNHHGYASRRMWAKCQVIGSHFTYNRSGPWFAGRDLCWGATIGCGTGTRVKEAWFEHGK